MTEASPTGAGERPRSIGILGGTGPQGRGLARRFAAAGYQVVIGSRSADRAESTAAELAAAGQISGAANTDAAGADLVIVAVPYDGHAELLAELAPKLAGKIVVDCVNRLGFDKQGPYAIAVPDGSCAQEAARILPDSTVIGAFHHVSSALLDDPEVTRIELDVLVLGEDRAAVEQVCDLAAAIPGARGIYGGRLRNAGQVEALTANIIAVNRRYKSHAGIRITDV
ncbi:NADPH-dependent F420 reductase [Microlunatus endophyticus]|uniref:NADPH-dependent F420 reductase n=1 Tax=Microlunatus endophyticus TaxID=1716077 RepID=A0A917SI31_9ACTN|nr:NADPH-dependent F420 reductase [Microlunatus endophyticus]GGL80993.1 NADPH-dependent F420 reductase [Microlunatus endophyticus]